MSAPLVNNDTNKLGHVHALCYVSLETRPFNNKDLRELVISSTGFNHENGISGVICYAERKFFQYIEGPKNTLLRLYESIESDPRHRIISTCHFGERHFRQFSNWSLMNVNTTSPGVSTLIESIVDIIEHGYPRTMSRGPQDKTLFGLIKFLGDRPLKKIIELDLVGRKIIVIGASAGGISAISDVLSELPKNLHASIIIAIHLSPNHDTTLHNVFERETGLTVRLAQNGNILLPGTVHLIPPGKNLVVVGGGIWTSEQVREEAASSESDSEIVSRIPMPIDILFTSVAKEYGKRALGIILSGTGHDGTQGAIALKEVGATVLAQAPETAEFPSMPQSAIDAQVVDRVTTTLEIAKIVTRAVNVRADQADSIVDKEDAAAIEKILQALAEDGNNFSNYKRKTILSRILRRMAAMGQNTLAGYASFVDQSSQERRTLKNELLVCVTSFFRDDLAWSNLNKLLNTHIIDDLHEDETLRVWVAGCSSGEEAYSVAILLHEEFTRLDKKPNFKIFATDLSDHNIQKTKEGTYRAQHVQSLQRKIKNCYFDQLESGDYQVKRFLREKVVAMVHNLISDPPYSNMHLVCCRNLIIYLEPNLRERAMSVLYFALNKNGLLFLGSSESIGKLSKEYRTLSNKWNIYQKKQDKRIALRLDQPPLSVNQKVPNRRRTDDAVSTQTSSEPKMYRQSFEALCKAQNKTVVILSDNRSVELVISDPIGLLEVATGQPGASIEKLLVNSLVQSVVVNLQQLSKLDKDRIVERNITCVDNHNKDISVDIEIYKLDSHSSSERWLLSCELNSTNSNTSTTAELPKTDQYTQMQEELEATRQKLADSQLVLHDTIQELEASNREQHDAFEQLSTANEELQSTNEELQSVNEELYTVNFEYQSKIHEISDLTHDMDNLMTNSFVGIIFVCSDLTIRRYSDQAANIVSLSANDIDKSVDTISERLGFPDLLNRVSQVISFGKGFECDIDHKSCTSRLHIGIYPYKIDSDISQGVMLTFLDLADLESFAVDLKKTTDTKKKVETKSNRVEIPET